MRNANRIGTMLYLIGVIWNKHPNIRLGQLLDNVCNDMPLYYIEDDDLIQRLKAFYNII